MMNFRCCWFVMLFYVLETFCRFLCLCWDFMFVLVGFVFFFLWRFVTCLCIDCNSVID